MGTEGSLMNVTVSMPPELMKMFEASLSAQIERGRGKVSVYDFTEFRDGDPVSVYGADGERTLAIWRSFCPTCGSTSCPNLKNAAAMCPGPAP